MRKAYWACAIMPFFLLVGTAHANPLALPDPAGLFAFPFFSLFLLAMNYILDLAALGLVLGWTGLSKHFSPEEACKWALYLMLGGLALDPAGIIACRHPLSAFLLSTALLFCWDAFLCFLYLDGRVERAGRTALVLASAYLLLTAPYGILCMHVAGLVVSALVVGGALLAFLLLRSPMTKRRLCPLGAGAIGALFYLLMLVPMLALLREVAGSRLGGY